MSSHNIIMVTSKQLESLQLTPEIVNEILRTREIIVDAENTVVGRLASVIAKLAKLGFKVHIINVEKAVVSGDKKTVVESYKLMLKVKTHKNPYRHTIHRSKHPINILKKTIKNMLPKHNWLKNELVKKVKVHMGIPQEFRSKLIIKILDCDAAYLGRTKVVSVAMIAKELGWKGVTPP
ncbi:MAG: 50S ribosomal protein L13 [Ignisphaera sp.]